MIPCCDPGQEMTAPCVAEDKKGAPTLAYLGSEAQFGGWLEANGVASPTKTWDDAGCLISWPPTASSSHTVRGGMVE